MALSAALSLHLQLVGSAGVDASEIERVTQRLRVELSELELESVSRPVAASVPAGVKAVGAAEAGQLALLLMPVVVPKLIDFVQAWCLRHKDRSVVIDSGSVRIEFPPGGIAPSEVAKIIKQLTQPTPAGSGR